MGKKILVTGGAGFVGSNLAIKLKAKNPNYEVICLDNLKRRGSELNVPRLKKYGIKFIHGDIRNKEDLEELEDIDIILECSAEPSVLAGINSSPNYLINTNLSGTVNCLELARKCNSIFIFLSTSRVYPIEKINNLKYIENDERFSLAKNQKLEGASEKGISEEFSLDGPRSLYGATKLCSELIFQEYLNQFGIKGVINRCGVITGPWQMGKVDQGVFVLWVAKHIYGGELSYIGYGGEGKQVRDFIHIDDLYDLIEIQIKDIDKFNGKTYNVGGGLKNSVSLKELTNLCQKVTGKKITIKSIKENRSADIKSYITDYSRIFKDTGWKPKKNAEQTVKDIADWINHNKELLKDTLS